MRLFERLQPRSSRRWVQISPRLCGFPWSWTGLRSRRPYRISKFLLSWIKSIKLLALQFALRFVRMKSRIILTGYVSLPMGAVEQRHGAKALEEHPRWIISQLDGDASRQGDKNCERKMWNCFECRSLGTAALTRRYRVASMIEQLSQRTLSSRSSGLFTVDSVQTLIHE